MLLRVIMTGPDPALGANSAWTYKMDFMNAAPGMHPHSTAFFGMTPTSFCLAKTF
jgi:hypothetical protein